MRCGRTEHLFGKRGFYWCSSLWSEEVFELRSLIVLLRFLVFATFVSLRCSGQHLEIGVRAGIPLTEAFGTGSFFRIDFGESATSATRRYTIGPMVELGLPRGFNLELDALYKRLGFDDLTKSSGLYYVHTRTTANSWEFPLVGGYQFMHLRVLSPLIGGGVSFRHLGGISSISEQPLFFPGIPPMRSAGTTSPALDNRSRHGGILTLGAKMRVGVLQILPEIRYTRWGSDRNLNPELHSNKNQIDFLLGVAFGKSAAKR